MRLSTRGEYGLLALVDIALHSQNGFVQAHEVAERQGIPKQYLDQLMLALKKAGFVESSRGRQGGYILARRPDTVSLLDVVTALEGPVRNVNFSATRRKSAASKILHDVCEDIWAHSITVLRDKTLEDVCLGCRSAELEPMYFI